MLRSLPNSWGRESEVFDLLNILRRKELRKDHVSIATKTIYNVFDFVPPCRRQFWQRHFRTKDSSQPHVEGIVSTVCSFMQQLRNTIPGEIEAAVTKRFTDEIFQGLYHNNFSICRDRSIADGGSLGPSSTFSKPIEFARQHGTFHRQTRNAGNDRKCVAILRTEPAVAALNEIAATDRRDKLQIAFSFRLELYRRRQQPLR